MVESRLIDDSLGSYLRTRRSQLTPQDAALPSPATGRRRVPGLRREEVAELVGVSIDYYVRLEQGRADRPSDAVLEALSRALRLGPAERTHLFDLARRGRPHRAERPEVLRPGLTRVVDAFTTTPAMVMNAYTDVLAWNPLAAALICDFAGLTAQERNMARLIFLDPASREVHVDWDRAAHDTVGILRMAAGRQPHQPALVRLVGELSLGSETFRRMWATHHVHEKTHGPKAFRHPLAGELALQYESFHVPGRARHTLVVYTAPAGSPAAEALNFLGSMLPHPPG
ncbi:helix-turn-helix transcriptional regulator [Kitasatospora mediocidica]|uniref:helix-turn-helix transcriptional regulator n=1 Tax=Kitasatospora mediocidica TaxID=58352 RepID=UPI00055C197B|nr:helix-turn-helix transcriptional regulator [Kitasatospora mediocidica]